MMKRVWTVAAALLLALALLAGCGNAKQDKELARGTIEGSTYVNEFAGITFDAPAGWEYTSDEQLAELMQMSADLLKESGVDLTAALSDVQVFFDMMCSNPTTGDNVIVQFENLSVAGNANMSEKEYIEFTEESMKQLGLTSDDIDGMGTATLGGQTYTTWGYHTDGFEQKMYMLKSGDFMISIIVTATGQGMGIDEIAAVIK